MPITPPGQKPASVTMTDEQVNIITKYFNYSTDSSQVFISQLKSSVVRHLNTGHGTGECYNKGIVPQHTCLVKFSVATLNLFACNKCIMKNLTIMLLLLLDKQINFNGFVV